MTFLGISLSALLFFGSGQAGKIAGVSNICFSLWCLGSYGEIRLRGTGAVLDRVSINMMFVVFTFRVLLLFRVSFFAEKVIGRDARNTGVCRSGGVPVFYAGWAAGIELKKCVC